MRFDLERQCSLAGTFHSRTRTRSLRVCHQSLSPWHRPSDVGNRNICRTLAVSMETTTRAARRSRTPRRTRSSPLTVRGCSAHHAPTTAVNVPFEPRTGPRPSLRRERGDARVNSALPTASSRGSPRCLPPRRRTRRWMRRRRTRRRRTRQPKSRTRSSRRPRRPPLPGTSPTSM